MRPTQIEGFEKIEGFDQLEPLYEGARSTVLRGVRATDGRRVVLKLLTATMPSRDALTRYRYSKGVTDALDVEGVAANLDLIQINRRPALVGEDIGGRSMAHWIDEGHA